MKPRNLLVLIIVGCWACAGRTTRTTTFGGEECRGISVNATAVSSLDENNGEQDGLYGECWKFTRLAFARTMDVTIEVRADGFAPEVSLVERQHLNRPLTGDFGRRDGSVTLHATLKNNTPYNILVVAHPAGATGDYRMTVTRD